MWGSTLVDSPTAIPSAPIISSSGNLGRQHDRLLAAAVVAGDEAGQLVIEELRAGQLGQPALDVARGGGRVAGEQVAEVPLALDQVLLVGQRDQGVADGGVAVGVVLHGVADDVGHLDEFAVVVLVQRMEDPALHRLEAVVQVGDRTVADDVGGVLDEVVVDHPGQRALAAAGTVAGAPSASAVVVSVAVVSGWSPCFLRGRFLGALTGGPSFDGGRALRRRGRGRGGRLSGHRWLGFGRRCRLL